jgi:hypothetical protein
MLQNRGERENLVAPEEDVGERLAVVAKEHAVAEHGRRKIKQLVDEHLVLCVPINDVRATQHKHSHLHEEAQVGESVVQKRTQEVVDGGMRKDGLVGEHVRLAMITSLVHHDHEPVPGFSSPRLALMLAAQCQSITFIITIPSLSKHI